MATYVCPHCEARNPATGRCVLCGRSLGSYRKALLTAYACAGLLGLQWIVFSLMTGLQLGLLALGFGVAVSGVMVWLSAGRGPIYQLIATSATIIGIVVSNVIVLACLSAMADEAGLTALGRLSWREWIDFGKTVALYDVRTQLWAFLGIVGGFFVWRTS